MARGEAGPDPSGLVLHDKKFRSQSTSNGKCSAFHSLSHWESRIKGGKSFEEVSGGELQGLHLSSQCHGTLSFSENHSGIRPSPRSSFLRRSPFLSWQHGISAFLCL